MNSTSPTIPSKKSPKRKINKISPSPFRGVLSLSAAATNTMLMMIPTAISEDDHDNTSTNHHKNKHSNLNPPNPENNEEKNSSNPSKTDKIDSSSPTTTMPLMPPSASARSKPITTFRSRKNPTNRLLRHSKRKRHRLGSSSKHHNANALNLLEEQPPPPFLRCCRDRTLVRSTLSCMNLVAKMLFWSSALASVAAVVWYSYELKNNGYVFFKIRHVGVD